VLGEDCALLGQDSSVGRRGMCGMVFIFKVNLRNITNSKFALLFNLTLSLTMMSRDTSE
jgi:hypothetical protein